MVKHLSHDGTKDPLKHVSLDQAKIPDLRLQELVTKNTCLFFEILTIPDSFLGTHPETWVTNIDYLQAEPVVHELRVINYTAERGVTLMQGYNALLTKDEEQTQFVLQVVKNYCSTEIPTKKLINTTVLKILAKYNI